MKTIGVRALRENPGVLSQSAAAGEFVLLTSHSKPISLALPFDEELLKCGVHISLALKLYQEGTMTLSKAATLAKLPIEDFLEHIASLDIAVADQSASELAADLGALDE
ncbi:MAG: UPF0175 family protein [Cellvibrionaceae bacterium]|nr:UPF0175 family protein [Cellvibrionaceae bacterium]MCV6625887.1 UPF0175 family protein [Cellvibrionaceae bacterium]